MSDSPALRKLVYLDVYISSIIHGYESLMLTVLLFIPAWLFSPQLILAPIGLLAYTFGFFQAASYVISIVLALLSSTYLKRLYRRPRPKPRTNLPLKPMFFRDKESNYSMPSGDCTQAAVFVYYFLINYEKGNLSCYEGDLVV